MTRVARLDILNHRLLFLPDHIDELQFSVATLQPHVLSFASAIHVRLSPIALAIIWFPLLDYLDADFLPFPNPCSTLSFDSKILT